jgi:hypothetical protein
VEGLAFQSPSPPPAADKQTGKRAVQSSAGPPAKRGQQPHASSHLGWQQGQLLPQPATLAAAGQHQQQQWQQQQPPAQAVPMQTAYTAGDLRVATGQMPWAAQQQQHTVPGSALQGHGRMQQQQQQGQQQQQALPRGGGWVRQVPTAAPAVAALPTSAAGATAGRHLQAQGQDGAAPQHVSLGPAQQAQLQQLKVHISLAHTSLG